jgi:ABC-type polysaccharide transport system, permease component
MRLGGDEPIMLPDREGGGVARHGIGARPFLRAVANNRILLLMLAPAVVYVIAFSYLPMGGLVLAFKDFNFHSGIFKSPWCGWDNFKYLFISNKLWPLTRNTLLYNLAFIGVGLVLEVGFAVLFNEIGNRIFKKTFQSLTFLPFFISWVVVVAISQSIFSYEHGILNKVLVAFGAQRENIYGDPKAWPFLLVGFRAWKMTGYGIVIYLSAITGIDPEIYEAATIDGANAWQKIRYVTLSSLVPTMIIMVLLSVGQIFRGDFGLFYQMVGNNGQILSVADILDLFVYRALATTGDIGMASAAGMYQSILCLVTIMTVNAVIKRIDAGYALF